MKLWASAIALLALAGQARGAARVIAVDVDGVVHPITAEIIAHALEQAKQENAALVLVRLNTPGGFLDGMRQAVERIVASQVPVAAFVTPSGGRAASAGFFLLEAADIAAMAPGTNTGSAHPVILGMQMDAVMRQKLENDAAASMRSLVTKRGRNSAVAETAVLGSKSFTDKEALEKRLIDLVARDEPDLLAQLDGREVTRFDGQKQILRLAGAQVLTYQKNWREKIQSAIADPNLSLALIVLGILGIYVEFTSPGLILPGVAGAILALLGLSAMAILPINWTGAGLLLLALTLFILEAKFASHGVLGAGGALAMLLGALLLIDSPIPEMRVRLSTALALTLPFTAITIFLLTLVVRARANKVVTGSSGMLGETGVALTDLNPAGRIFVHGEYWNAVAASEIKLGSRVRVVSIDGLNLTVEPVP